MAKVLKFEKNEGLQKKPSREADVTDIGEYRKRKFLLDSRELSRLTFVQFKDYIMFIRLSSSNVHLKEVNILYLTAADYEAFLRIKDPDLKAAGCAEYFNTYTSKIEYERKQAEMQKDKEKMVKMRTRYSFLRWTGELFREKMRNESGSL